MSYKRYSSFVLIITYQTIITFWEFLATSLIFIVLSMSERFKTIYDTLNEQQKSISRLGKCNMSPYESVQFSDVIYVGRLDKQQKSTYIARNIRVYYLYLAIMRLCFNFRFTLESFCFEFLHTERIENDTPVYGVCAARRIITTLQALPVR